MQDRLAGRPVRQQPRRSGALQGTNSPLVESSDPLYHTASTTRRRSFRCARQATTPSPPEPVCSERPAPRRCCRSPASAATLA
ncbi:MAG: hypothetical protein MZU84_03250 [Sphingobacterium sp.]|nr:hypothetical protein [Sphingobacterium sp.]